MTSKPMNNVFMERLKEAQQKDVNIQELLNFTIDGWPIKKKVPKHLMQFYEHRHEI